jgi:hypothetical protein
MTRALCTKIIVLSGPNCSAMASIAVVAAVVADQMLAGIWAITALSSRPSHHFYKRMTILPMKEPACM